MNQSNICLQEQQQQLAMQNAMWNNMQQPKIEPGTEMIDQKPFQGQNIQMNSLGQPQLTPQQQQMMQVKNSYS